MNAIQETLNDRWQRIFCAAATNLDIPPSLVLRAEGLMEALVLSRLSTQEDVWQAMAAVYQDSCGTTLEAEFGVDWSAVHPFPQIPAVMARAPVVPSTKE